MEPVDLVLPEIREIIKDNPKELALALEDFHEVEIAQIYQRLSEEENKIFVASLSIEVLSQVFLSLEKKERRQIISQLPSGKAAKLIEQLSPDDRADFLQELPSEICEALLATVDRQIVRDIRALMNYPPDSAGGIMTTEFIKVYERLSVDECLKMVRRLAVDHELIYTIYVADEESGMLMGVVSLRDLLVSSGDIKISDIMTTQVITVNYNQEQQEVAELISKYDLLAIPVVDHHNRMIGVITIDDILDVVKEEQSEDIQRIGALQPIEESYFDTPFFSLMKKRASWLVMLFFGELLTSNAMRHFEDSIKASLALVFFVPLVLSSGGNSGSQSSTLVIRSIVMGEIQNKKRIVQLLSRELLMGAALGTVLGIVGFFRALIWNYQQPSIAVVVTLTLLFVVIIGTTVGTGLPLLFKRLGFDPAVSSAPFIASLVDVLGIVAFFTIAKIIL